MLKCLHFECLVLYLCANFQIISYAKEETGMPFEAHPSPKVAENGEKLLYVKPQSGLVRTLSEFEMWFHDKFSLRQGDMNRVFEAMLDGAPEWFAAGYRIETPIGTFSPKLKLKRQVTDPDDISHDDVELDGIEFQPSKSFIKNMEYAVVRDGFRYVRKPQSNRLLNNQQHLEKALQQCIKEHGYATVASFAAHSGLTDHSARRQLDKWCYGDNPKLQFSRFGRIHIYTEI